MNKLIHGIGNIPLLVIVTKTSAEIVNGSAGNKPVETDEAERIVRLLARNYGVSL